MSFPTDNLPQTITHWSPGTRDQFGGMTFGTPVALKGKWEDKSILFINQLGEEVRSEAIVYLDTDVVVEGFLFLGSSTIADPRTVTNAREIRAFSRIPTLDATNFERRVML